MNNNSPNARSTQLAAAAIACCAALVTSPSVFAAPQETVLYSFAGPSTSGIASAGPRDGAFPSAALILDSAGNLYGTTIAGGASGDGTVFKLSPSGTERVLYSFCSLPACVDGSMPYQGDALITDRAGNLYGTTVVGGAFAGTVFKVTPGGTETVLYSFCNSLNSLGQCVGGGQPFAGLIADSAGNFYGTATAEGASFNGTVFKLTPGGIETALHTFAGPPDGALPYAGLVSDSAGNLYGTTVVGGASGDGTVFKVSPRGTETVLHSFGTSRSDGVRPESRLIADSAGNLYGTTVSGGASSNGTVFKVSPSGTETVLYSFAVPPDGADPVAGLIADSAGNLYGTTIFGGATGNGTVFKVSPSGTETVLHSFAGPPDGALPFAGLVADSAGNLYGTTQTGGASSLGTVFKITATGFVTPATELAELLASVTGVGPGKSLAEKVRLAQTYYSANDIPTTCSMLASFVSEVNAQSGKKISHSFAAQLVGDAQSIQTAIGCGPQ